MRGSTFFFKYNDLIQLTSILGINMVQLNRILAKHFNSLQIMKKNVLKNIRFTWHFPRFEAKKGLELSLHIFKR